MKRLIIKLSFFFAICLGLMTFVLIKYGGTVDYFYEKFTTPRAQSMIIGDSRSFQGIQPQVMNEYFRDSEYEIPVLNYSFTIAQAIIGPLYNNSIFKKLDSSSDNGIFVISLTPGMLVSFDEYDNEKGEYREAGQPPHNMNFVDINPNYEYLIKNLSYFHFKAVFKKKAMVHKDGWLEETNLPTSKKVFEEWRKNQINLFLNYAKISSLSKVRIQSLDDLIKRLDKHGHVFIVRMPISKEFLSYEEKYFPRFESVIDSIAVDNKISYFNFNNSDMKFNTYDGHHIDKFAGKDFTKVLCDSISYSIKNKRKLTQNNLE